MSILDTPHMVNCSKNGRTRRHSALRDCWSSLLTNAAISHVREAVSRTGQRPADILLLSWDKGRDIAVDFTVSSPLTSDCYPLTLEGARRHLANAEEQKYSQERRTQSATLMHWGLQPAAFSPWGGMGPSARHLLFEVTKRATSGTSLAASNSRLNEIKQSISMTLAREVARQLSLTYRILDS